MRKQRKIKSSRVPAASRRINTCFLILLVTILAIAMAARLMSSFRPRHVRQRFQTSLDQSSLRDPGAGEAILVANAGRALPDPHSAEVPNAGIVEPTQVRATRQPSPAPAGMVWI